MKNILLPFALSGCLLLALSGFAVTGAPEAKYETTTHHGDIIRIPDNVQYIETSPEVYSEAERKIREYLADHINLGEVFGLGNDSIQALLVGGFVRQRMLEALGDTHAFNYPNFRAQIALCMVQPYYHCGWAIADQEQAVEFFSYFAEVYSFSEGCIIRNPRTDEFAIIWRLIGWPITEPIFVLEEYGIRLVIDFDPEFRTIEWMEDITDVKFSVPFGDQSIVLRPVIMGEPRDNIIYYVGSDFERMFVVESH